MSDLVLVRYDLGDEYEITARGRLFAEAHGLEVLDDPARHPDGSIVEPHRVSKLSGRPAKPKTSVAAAAEKKAESTADSAPSSKEK